jgi:hypothetical protein
MMTSGFEPANWHNRTLVGLVRFDEWPLIDITMSVCNARSDWLLVTLLSIVISAHSETIVKGRPSLVLETKAAAVVVDLGGGSIVQFQLQDQRLNPLTWTWVGEEVPAVHPMGHFLCLDRWGAPSDAEAKNGMPFHGEAGWVFWRVTQEPSISGRDIWAEMETSLPMAGFEVKRRIRLFNDLPLMFVSESVTNKNKLGRIYNMVQHPTIAPPFLDETTLVDSNGRKGFMQSNALPNPEEPVVYWPQALKDGQPVNLRHLIDDPEPDVVSFTIDDEYGWTTAMTARRNLLIGYIWRTSDYPWLDVWRDAKDGKPIARGMEFGTAGLHRPDGMLVAKGQIFGRMLYAHLDAGQTSTRSYAAFLFKIPNDYRGVDRTTYQDGRLILHERGAGPERDLTMQVDRLFADEDRSR